MPAGSDAGALRCASSLLHDGAVIGKLDAAPAGRSAGQHTLLLWCCSTILPADLVSLVFPLLLAPQLGPRPFWGSLHLLDLRM